MANRVELKIAGRGYTLSADEGEDYMRTLADFVSARILGFKRQNNASPVDAATLAALAIADELFKERRKKQEDSGR